MKGIHPHTEIYKNILAYGPKNFDESISIPPEKYKFNAEVAIYDNKIGYITSKYGGTAIIIESVEMSEVMKNVFDLAFEEAKRLNKQIIQEERKMKSK